MKKFPSDLFKLLVQARYFRNTTTICENVEFLSNTNHLKTIESIPASFIKGRTKENAFSNSGTHIAKKATHITTPPLSMHFTMKPEESCNKLQGQIDIFSSKKCFKTKVLCPNALTKHLKCQKLSKGVEMKDLNEKIHCNSIGRDCTTKDPCITSSVTKPQTKQKTENTLETLISKLTTIKLFGPSGFFNENHVVEFPNKLRTETGPKESMTYVKNMSDREKSPEIKFGAQNLCGGVNLMKESDTFFSARAKLSEFPRNEEMISSKGGLGKMVKSKRIGDVTGNDPGGQDKVVIKPKNPQRKVQNKQKNTTAIRRRRRKPRWFSRIPIEPNVKGSVIFASGTAQELEDPCKILSVNFSDSNLHPMKERIEENPDDNRCKSAVQHLMNNYDFMTNDENSNIGSSKVYGNSYTQKDSKTRYTNHAENNEARVIEEFFQGQESTRRQKKISKLDKTVKCIITLPEKQKQIKKRQKRVKKHSDSTTACHAFTTNNLFINFNEGEICVEKLSKDVSGTKSDTSFVKIKDISPIFESADEEENPRSRFSTSKNILPGLTRPVTQKDNHLNLLESKVIKTASESIGKIKDENVKKKAVSTGNKFETKGVNYQQYRMKSTDKPVASSRCDYERRPCHHRKNDMPDCQFPLDWDYDQRLPDNIARKWNTLECPKVKDTLECPITNEDLKKGLPDRKRPSAAAINRCNFEECKHRLRCRRPGTRCGIPGSTNRPYK